MNRNSRITNEHTCGAGDDEDYVRFDRTYLHNSSLPYTITINTNGVNTQFWGVK